MFRSLFRRRSPFADAANQLYGRIVGAARTPTFYEQLGVPDTLDGRFDMVVVHMALVLRRLSSVTPDAAPDKTLPQARLAQDLFDLMFRDMDRTLREIGISDLKIGKEIKKMVRAYYGRALAYETGLRAGALEKAVRENVFRMAEGTPAQIAALAAYMRREAAALDAVAEADLLAGRIAFGSPIPPDSVTPESPAAPDPVPPPSAPTAPSPQHP